MNDEEGLTDAAEGYVGRHIAVYKGESDPRQADPDFLAGSWSVRIAEEVNRLLNESAGRNQVWLGEQMGISPARVSYIVNASQYITLYTLAKLAVVLGVRAEVSLNPDRYSVRHPEEVVTDLQLQKTNVTPATTESTTTPPYGAMLSAA